MSFSLQYSLDDIGFSLSKVNEPFYFNLKDKSGNIYYHFDGCNFLYTDTLIIFDQLLTSKYIYGFGERNYNFNLDIGRYTIWGNDTTYTNRDERNGGWNLMGHQPVGLHRTKSGKYIGLLFINANCQDIVINTKVRDFIAPHMKGFDSGYNISIILKIAYERLWNTENGSANEFLRKIFLNPIEQRVVIEQEFKQEGSRLSNKVINNFVKYINGTGRNPFVVKLRNADMEILKKTDPEAY